MVFVEGGTFTMGCTAGQEDDCYYDSAEERPHLVTLSNFYIGKTEVTQAQWKAVMGADDPALLRAQTYFSYFSNAGDNNPMTWVSWDDITKPNGFLAKLNAQTGKNYRLPTEAEWEYAARGGKNGIAHDYKYSGSNVVDDVAWYARNTLSAGHLGPQPVGTKAANELGIHDMSGNVSEWVSDWYDRIYYEIYGSSSVTNPQGPSTGSARVFRGGGWSDPSPSSYLRVGVRDSWSPESYSFDRGFRLADGNNGGTDTAIKMVKVQGGTFTMGCTAGQANDCYYDEKPTHSVTLSDFYIGKTEVTQAQWKAVMGANDPVLRNVLTVHSNQAGDDRPMILVSWDDITKSDGFLAKLNAQTGKNYRLPTEAEWEYAARGGKDGVAHDYKYSGSNIADDVAWYFGTIGYDYTGPIAVGAKAANELGIHDMSGNVSEWVSDWYGIDYYLSSPTTNPQGPSTGSSRVLRGGSFGNPAASIGVSHRNRSGPDYQFSSLGFRLASSSE
jgi:formylglycine-generating enzyme required for sulfatase activity